MKKLVACAGLAAALVCFTDVEAFGHGGQYRGPGDTVPPNLGGGGDTTPPGNPGGPGTPGPGAPTTGGARGPATGGGPAGPVGGAPTAGRPTTGGFAGRRAGGGEGYERWEFWWEHNKEPFLDLKNRLGNTTSVSGSSGFLIGRVKDNAAVSANRPTPADVKNRILPEVLPLLQETHQDVVDSAVLAAARMLRAEDAAVALQQITATLGHDAVTARESAALSLGVLGSGEAVETVKQLMMDTREGRQMTGKPNGVEDRVRAFAAAALGMIGDPSTIQDFKDVITDPRQKSKRDLLAVSILSLGLMPSGHEDIVPFLKGLMTDRGMDRIVRAQAPIALGKLKELNNGSSSATAALSDVVSLFEDDKTDNDMMRSLACCIGMLAEVADTEAVDALMNAVKNSNDDQTRHYSIMALAQIGARDEEPAANAETHSRLNEFFLQELTKPKRVAHQPYGALGLAVYARNEKLKEQGTAREAAIKITEAFGKTNNPSYQAAMAVSLGLLNHTPAKEVLWEKYEDSHNQPLKGYIALALGMMRADYGEQFRSAVQTKGLEFKFRLQLARALGLMGDVNAVSTLISYLQDSETLSETSATAQALGLIGDRSAIDPLLEICKDSKKQPLTRGFACVALGIIAEKTDLPWNSRFAVNSNYRAKVPALSEILDIL